MEKTTLEQINKKLDTIISIFGIKLNDSQSNKTKKVKTVTPPITKKRYEIPNNSDSQLFENDRAFFKKYVKNLSGAKKMVLLIFFLTKGEIGKEVSYEEIIEKWNKFSAILGGKLTQRSYFTRAKERNWINSSKYSSYFLTKNWKGIYER